MSSEDVNVCMLLEEELEKICDYYCKYLEEYYGQYKDPDEAQEVMQEEKCKTCPIGKVL